MELVWKLWFCKESFIFWTLVWISMVFNGYKFCSISRVLLRIHPNPRFVESCVGKTLVGIR